MILKIGGKIFDFFNKFTLELKYDSVGSTFSFDSFFDPENPDYRKAFRPSDYSDIVVEHNDELLLTGTLLSNTFVDEKKDSLISLGGYSTAGVFEDCQMPTTLYPLQSDGLSIREIAQKITNSFGVRMVVDSSVATRMNKVLETSTAKVTQTVKAYLASLTTQQNIVMSNTERGELLFTQAKTNQTPLINYEEGIPFPKMTLGFDGQGMHSPITVMKEADTDGGNAGQTTLTNPFVNSFRPKVMVQTSGDDNDTLEAAKNVRATELKGITLTIDLDRWELNGKIVKPNNVITVVNPKLFLYNKSTWFIESVTLTEDNKKQTSVIKCVLPSVYDGSTPKNIF